MKLSIQRETLLKPLQLVVGVVERKQTLAILSNVLLNTKDNILSITGTDLEVELVGETPLDKATIESSLTVPGRKLMDICKALPENAAIELYQEKERVILKSGRSRFTLTTLPALDFPNIETQEGTLTFSIPQQELRHLFQRTAFAMAQQDVRYYLNGVLLEISSNHLCAVATDGHRLALNVADIEIEGSHRLQIIIPRKGVTELMRLLDDSEDSVTITLSNNHIRIAGNFGTFTSKLIDGRFPDYQRVIPTGGNKIILIDRDTLKSTLSRIAILSNEKFRGVRFELKRNLLRILTNNPEQEAAEDELSVEYQGEKMEIGFNVNYLLDILNVLKPGPVKFTFSDSNSSMLVEEPDGNGESIFVVMPMRL